jgi:glutamyl-tRNA synthetase
LAEDIVPYLQAKGYAVPADSRWTEKMIASLRERAKTMVELVEMAGYYFEEEIAYDEKAAAKFLTAGAVASMTGLADKLAALEDFSAANIEQAFADTLQEHGLKMGELAQPVRVALTGSTVSPGIHEVISVLGKARSVARLKRAIVKAQS